MLVVSILVLVDVPLKQYEKTGRDVTGIVSILVLVDVPLKQFSYFGTGGHDDMVFQSLFWWMFH